MRGKLSVMVITSAEVTECEGYYLVTVTYARGWRTYLVQDGARTLLEDVEV